MSVPIVTGSVDAIPASLRDDFGEQIESSAGAGRQLSESEDAQSHF